MNSHKPQTLKEKLADSRHQPSKAEMEEDVSVRTTPEALASAVVKGGAPRREPSG